MDDLTEHEKIVWLTTYGASCAQTTGVHWADQAVKQLRQEHSLGKCGDWLQVSQLPTDPYRQAGPGYKWKYPAEPSESSDEE